MIMSVYLFCRWRCMADRCGRALTPTSGEYFVFLYVTLLSFWMWQMAPLKWHHNKLLCQKCSLFTLFYAQLLPEHSWNILKPVSDCFKNPCGFTQLSAKYKWSVKVIKSVHFNGVMRLNWTLVLVWMQKLDCICMHAFSAPTVCPVLSFFGNVCTNWTLAITVNCWISDEHIFEAALRCVFVELCVWLKLDLDFPNLIKV